jgi:hypothetical protein
MESQPNHQPTDRSQTTMTRSHDTANDGDDESKSETTNGDTASGRSTPSRRAFLAGGASLTAAASSGCLGIGNPDRATESQPRRPSATASGTEASRADTETDQYSTVERTTTFSELTGERTPYPAVQPVHVGSRGRLLLLFFDYDHPASIQWWQETYPEIQDLIDDETVRLQFGTHPVPVSKWSMMLPSALLAVAKRVGNDAAVEFHHGLIDAAPNYSHSLLRTLAERVGADPEVLVTAARDRRRRDQILSMREFGQKRGVESLPAAYHPDGLLSDASAETIRERYETETKSD